MPPAPDSRNPKVPSARTSLSACVLFFLLIASAFALPVFAEPGAAENPDAEAEAGGEEWLVDDNGFEYKIVTVPKVEGTYLRQGETHVKFPGGAILRLEREDEEKFWVRSYKPVPLPERKPKKPPEPPEIEGPEYPQEVDQLELAPFDHGLPRSGQWRNGFDLADMNGDGHVDIVFGPARKSSVTPNIFLGDSKGNWRPWQGLTFDGPPLDYGAAAAGDWNGDGHMDVAFGVHLRGVVVFVHDGEGHFTTWSEGIPYGVPGGGEQDVVAFSSRALEAVDWDGDGRTDIVAIGEGPGTGGGRRIAAQSRGTRIFVNGGDGTWKTVVEEGVRRRTFGDALVLADLDADGDQDIVQSSGIVGYQGVLIYRQDDGKLAERALPGMRRNALVDGVTALDLDGDGQDELALGYRHSADRYWRAGVDIFQRKGAGWVSKPLFSMPQRESVRSLAGGDINGDGHVDLVALDDRGLLRLFVNDGSGNLLLEATPEGPEEAGACYGFHLELHDFDGDGKDEIVAAFAGEKQGDPLLGFDLPGCPRQGSLRAWTVRPKTADEGAEGETPSTP